jgi:protein subunit release factor B
MWEIIIGIVILYFIYKYYVYKDEPTKSDIEKNRKIIDSFEKAHLYKEMDEKRERERERERKNKLIEKFGEESAQYIIDKKLFLGMNKEMLVEVLGNPSDKKETVTKDKVINKHYYNPRETRQNTTVYGLEVTLENDIVISWKDL